MADHLIVLSALPNVTESMNLVEAVSAVTSTFAEQGQLVEDDQQTQVSALSVQLAEKLKETNPDSEVADAVTETVVVKNQQVAEQNNGLSADDLPLLPPEL